MSAVALQSLVLTVGKEKRGGGNKMSRIFVVSQNALTSPISQQIQCFITSYFSPICFKSSCRRGEADARMIRRLSNSGTFERIIARTGDCRITRTSSKSSGCTSIGLKVSECLKYEYALTKECSFKFLEWPF